METILLDIPAGADPAQAEAVIEGCCAAEGLRPALKSSLARYPGCVHWHYKQGKEPGTLEITLWPQERRAWFSIRPNRRGPWLTETAARLKLAIKLALENRE
ncbi:MAG: hypothetical protein L0322_24630 [Chloroflexi bacterium]|nr:hypothetical protein [Chloroflexota bacterium]